MWLPGGVADLDDDVVAVGLRHLEDVGPLRLLTGRNGLGKGVDARPAQVWSRRLLRTGERGHHSAAQIERRRRVVGNLDGEPDRGSGNLTGATRLAVD